MAEQEFSVTRKMGRPRGRVRPETAPIRVAVQLLERVDAFIALQPEPKPSRSEMIRKILEDRLVHEGAEQAELAANERSRDISDFDPAYRFSRLAVDKAKLCITDRHSSNPPPRVGFVLARGDVLIGWSAKGIGGEIYRDGTVVAFESKEAEHAEFALLSRLSKAETCDATAYATLEPCTSRKDNRKPSCANMIVSAGVSTVFIGNCDPNPDVGALAWKVFHSAGIKVKDFPPELRNEAHRDNERFFQKFKWSQKESGNASFDYMNNERKRELGPPGRSITTYWSNRGPGSIYAIDYQNHVCVAKNCVSFSDIDDPGRWFEDKDYAKPVDNGQIVIFRNAHGFALVQILSVRPPEDGTNSELHFRYELRYSSESHISPSPI